MLADRAREKRAPGAVAGMVCAALLASGCVVVSRPEAELSTYQRTEQYAAIATDAQDSLPVFVAWYESCDSIGCKDDRSAAQEYLAACIQAGVGRRTGAFRAVAGEPIAAAPPLDLVEDPRSGGAPDERLDAGLREALLRQRVRYALLLEVRTRIYGPRKQSRRSADASVPWIVSRDTYWLAETRLVGALLDVETRRWVAATGRRFSGPGSSSTLYGFFLPAFALEQTPDTEVRACESAGESIAEMLAPPRPAR